MVLTYTALLHAERGPHGILHAILWLASQPGGPILGSRDCWVGRGARACGSVRLHRGGEESHEHHGNVVLV